MNADTEKLLHANQLNASDVEVICPHCDSEQKGWVLDPRGRTELCDSCGQSYYIPENLKISLS